jgi:hypothetical protein
MVLHRIAGLILALIGFTILGGLAFLIFAPSDQHLALTIQIGIPGVLLLLMGGLCSLAFGMALATEPGATMRQARRVHRAVFMPGSNRAR